MSKVQPLEIKRHVQHLSEKETDELVSAMAELFVAYIKRHGIERKPAPQEPENGRTPRAEAEA